MMRKFCLALFVGTLSILIGLQVKQSQSVVDDVLLENVEALALPEELYNITCEGIGDFTCPLSGDNVEDVYRGYSLR